MTIEIPKQLARDIITTLLTLRDFHDETCEFETLCHDSVEANRLAEKLEELLSGN